MTEWTERRQQRRYMAWNLVAFTVIFGLFAAIIYLQIQQSLFSRLDDDLLDARAMIEGMDAFVDMQIAAAEQFPDGSGGRSGSQKDLAQEPAPPQQPPADIPPGDLPPEGERADHTMRYKIPMRVQIIVRDAAGTVYNGQMLGRLFWEDQLDLIPFSADRVDEIQSFRVEGGSYRALTFVHESAAGEDYYIQLLASADGEQGIIDSFLQILIVCVFVFVLLSITASYILSRKNMKPLIRAWERQNEFVENASHELRTPLTIIQNKLESLLTTPNATILDKADSVAISLSETRRLSKLTSDLMTLARADSSQQQLQLADFSLDDVVQQVCAPYAELAEAQEKVLRTDLQHQGLLCADRERIHELLVILLDNALKYTRAGDTVTVSTLVREGRAILRVADTGIGIGEESRERIFDRFYREDKARSRAHGGTGLGLSIALWIVDTHGGSIRALPNEPSGTVFEVRIPN